MNGKSSDKHYLEFLWRALRVCARYRPMFGRGRKGGMSLAEFQALYQADPFYAWVGLDSLLMYAAHKAAGGGTLWDMQCQRQEVVAETRRVSRHVLNHGGLHWVPLRGRAKLTKRFMWQCWG